MLVIMLTNLSINISVVMVVDALILMISHDNVDDVDDNRAPSQYKDRLI